MRGAPLGRGRLCALDGTTVQSRLLMDGGTELGALYFTSVNWMKKPMAHSEKRGADRIEVALPSILRSPQGGRAVQIRNLSADGVMVVGEPGLAPGETVELHIPKVGWIDARVAWSMDTRAGLTFNSPIDLNGALAALRHNEPA